MWSDMHDYQPEIFAQVQDVKLLSDFVLVKAFPPPSAIINPGVRMTKDYRWRSDRPRGLQYGTVVAVGKGDRYISTVCHECEAYSMRIEPEGMPMPGDNLIGGRKRGLYCSKCNSSDVSVVGLNQQAAIWRGEMPVKVGDVVVYPRVPANDIRINGEEYTACHLEQHILAVVDEEDMPIGTVFTMSGKYV